MRKAKAMDKVPGIAVGPTVVKPPRDTIFKTVLGFILACSLILCACEETPSPTFVPTPPSDLIATVASSSQIDLEWQDKSDNEAGFKIERKTGAEGTWSQIATVGSNASSYSDTALATSTTYYYKVRSYNLAGHSGHSNEACCINVPIFKQCDSSWEGNQLGSCSGKTVCSHGCAVTSVAMVLKYYGVDTNPGDLNTWLANSSGYVNDCDIVWERAADRSGGSVEWAEKYTTDPNDWGRYSTNLSDQVKWEINHGYPCVGRANSHFVVINGYSDSLYSVNNPYHDDSTISQSSITAIYTYHEEGLQCSPMVAAGRYHTVGLKSNGNVIAIGYNGSGECNVANWTDITQVAAGWSGTVGLKSDGTVVAVGSNTSGQLDVGDWTNIKQVATVGWQTVGVKADATAVAVGPSGGPLNGDFGQCNVGGWTEITQVATGWWDTVGLKSNGTVVAVGRNEHGECNTGGWTDIIQVAEGNCHTVGLRSDGTVVAVGDNGYGQCNVANWTNIVQISAESYRTAGVKSDGTVVIIGWDYCGDSNVGNWTDIIQVAVGYETTVGLKSDGTVVAVGYNGNGECNVGDWNLN